MWKTALTHMRCCSLVAIATEMSVWEGVVVTPSDKAYEKQEKAVDEDEEDDDDDMDTEAK